MTKTLRSLLSGIVLFNLAVAQANAEELAKLGLDDTSHLGPKIELDASNKIEGNASIKISTEGPSTVYLGQIDNLDVENSQLVYSAKVKTELQGSAYLEMWVQVGKDQYFSRGMNNSQKGAANWKTIKTPFMLQKGQKATKAILNLVINGSGQAWIDDIVLSKEPLK